MNKNVNQPAEKQRKKITKMEQQKQESVYQKITKIKIHLRRVKFTVQDKDF